MGEKPGGTLGAREEWEEECWDDGGVGLVDGGDRLGLRLKQESRLFNGLGQEGNRSDRKT